MWPYTQKIYVVIGGHPHEMGRSFLGSAYRFVEVRRFPWIRHGNNIFIQIS